MVSDGVICEISANLVHEILGDSLKNIIISNKNGN